MKRVQKIIGSVGFAAAFFVTGCASDGSSRSTGQFIDDTAIHAKAKAALINDPVVSGTKINVEVHEGVVTLSGAVNGEVAKTKAEEIARGVDGVRSVQNELIVRQEAVGSSPGVSSEVKVDAETDRDADADADVDADLDLDDGDGVKVEGDLDVK